MKLKIFEGLIKKTIPWILHLSSKAKGRGQNVTFGGNVLMPRYKYHESLGNVTPADVYFGRAKKLKMKRQETKMKTLKERRETNRKISA